MEKTTFFAMVAAAGQVLERSTTLPPWAWTIGELLSTIGTVGLGYSAADRRPRTENPGPPKVP